MTIFKMSMRDGSKSHQEEVDSLWENVLEGIYKYKSSVFEQLRLVFAKYYQELSRDQVTPNS